MDLGLIEMKRDEAKRLFSEYRAAVRARHNEEDAQIMRGYKALAEGHQLIDIRDTMERGGFDENGFPRLALARATDKTIWCELSTQPGTFAFHWDTNDWRHRCQRANGRCIAFRSIPVAEEQPQRAWSEHMRAIVPTVPPALRPNISLSNFQILWEAKWEKIPRPPRDPALLRRLGGALYAVLAIWDLTEVERAVLSGRMRETN